MEFGITDGMKSVQMPALGRKFKLGMLYDCRKEQIISTLDTLWKPENLKNATNVQYGEVKSMDIISGDTMEAKMAALDIHGEMTLSVLAGNIPLKGSAKLIQDTATYSNQPQATVKHMCKIRQEELNLHTLADVELNNISGIEEATHVVAGIQYGSQTFFVFEQTMPTKEQVVLKDKPEDIHDKFLNILAREVKNALACLGDTFKLNFEELLVVGRYPCKFYSYFQPGDLPENLCDATRLWMNPSDALLPSQGQAIPLNVSLIPLKHFTQAASTASEISDDLVRRTLALAISSYEFHLRYKGLGMTTPLEISRRYWGVFLEKLADVTPKIRQGLTDESELEDILNTEAASPFGPQELKTIMKVEEVKAFYHRVMKQVKICSTWNNYCTMLQGLKQSYCICFNFNPTQINQMIDKVAEQKYNQFESLNHKAEPDEEFSSALVNRVKNFMDFASLNQENPEVYFTVVMPPSADVIGSIQLYKYGKLADAYFNPPSSPGRPELINARHDTIRFRWDVPKNGNINVSYYKIKQRQSDKNQWSVLQMLPTENEIEAQGLEPDTDYQFQVDGYCSFGLTPPSKCSTFRTLPTSPPSRPHLTKLRGGMVAIQWKQPEYIGEGVEINTYKIKRAFMYDNTPGKWVTVATASGEVTMARAKLEPGRSCRFKLGAVSGKVSSEDSSESESIFAKHSKQHKYPKEKFFDCCTEVASPGGMKILQVSSLVTESDAAAKVRRIEVGEHIPGKVEVVLLIVGASGEGKTTFIDGLFNYIVGVSWKDNYRFKLVDEDIFKDEVKIGTKWTTIYNLHHDEGYEVPYTVSVIDTPGFVGNVGNEVDLAIQKQICCLINHDWMDHIKAIGLVVQASHHRLSDMQKHTFQMILSMFSKNMHKNIIPLVTFAESIPPKQRPKVLDALRAADVPFESYYKFSNMALFPSCREEDADEDEDDDDDDDDDVSEKYWNRSKKNYEAFLNHLENIVTECPIPMKEVLQEQSHFEVQAKGLYQEIQKGLELVKQGEVNKEVKISDREKTQTQLVPSNLEEGIVDRRKMLDTLLHTPLELDVTEEGNMGNRIMTSRRIISGLLEELEASRRRLDNISLQRCPRVSQDWHKLVTLLHPERDGTMEMENVLKAIRSTSSAL